MSGARNTTITLTSNTVASVTLDQIYRLAELEMGATSPSDVYFTVDGTTPSVKGTNCWLLAGIGGTFKRVMIPPNAMGQQNPGVSSDFNQPATVKLISSGTPTVTISGVG